MPRTGDPVALFEEERPRLRALAYRMLGSLEDAEDVVQETFVRWHAAPHAEIAAPAAWLTTVCTRLSIDALRSAYRKRESYVGPWLPEPIVAAGSAADDPADLADSLSLAFLVLLERLSPLERAALLLHDVFDYEYREVAAALDRSEAACRQLVSRARRQVRGGAPRFPAPPGRAADLLGRFLAAAREGEIEQLQAMLTEDAELWSDGGGEVAAARNIVRGADRVARFLAGIARREDAVARPASVNGAPGAVVLVDGRVMAVVTVALDPGGRVERVFLVVSPRKLGRVPPGAEGMATPQA